ncbi:MAG: hypothetical protein Q7S74_01870 [Nanoarchaeota archaeon]|nr:hypothetical protein [Nanoarchaeota archaeon]
MAEETKILIEKKKTVKKKVVEQPKVETSAPQTVQVEETKKETKVETTTQEKKKEPEKETKKEKVIIKKKYEAVTHGKSLPISKKHSMYICSFIMNKPIDAAMSDLERVTKLKKIVPFKGEIPHRKGKGMMSGRYPITASKEFITLLKGLRGNALMNGLDLEKTKISLAHCTWASRPRRKEGRLAKRTNVTLKAREFQSEVKK